jgi:hypothetical protein
VKVRSGECGNCEIEKLRHAETKTLRNGEMGKWGNSEIRVGVTHYEISTLDASF